MRPYDRMHLPDWFAEMTCRGAWHAPTFGDEPAPLIETDLGPKRARATRPYGMTVVRRTHVAAIVGQRKVDCGQRSTRRQQTQSSPRPENWMKIMRAPDPELEQLPASPETS